MYNFKIINLTLIINVSFYELKIQCIKQNKIVNKMAYSLYILVADEATIQLRANQFEGTVKVIGRFSVVIYNLT